MVIKNIELSKFEKKADYYLHALINWPNARNHEIDDLIKEIDDFVLINGLDKTEITIVDFMSGNGILSYNLLRNGFSKIYSIECSNKLTEDNYIYNYEGINLLKCNKIEESFEFLNKIKPTIICSVAGFHHLLVHNDNKSILRPDSILYQKGIISELFNALSGNGVIFIEDLYESNILDKVHLENWSLKWFRKIVDKYVSIGHDDCALCQELITSLDFIENIEFKELFCPWEFEIKTDLYKYVYYKFGFALDMSFDVFEDSYKSLLDYLIIKEANYLFPWNLGVLKLAK